MATITKEQAQQQLKAALSAYREMLDAFVNNQVPRAAAQTDRIPSPGTPNAHSVKPR
jgi:hypothetical protein